MNCSIVIPAYNPGIQLCEYVRELTDADFNSIIIVNDGSKKECDPIFDTLRSMPQITLLTHAVNMGKGRALKDAFNYFLVNIVPQGYSGVITADSDGQHLSKDVLRVAGVMQEYPDSLILGRRDFDKKQVPLKSRYGNPIVSMVLKSLVGGTVSDTQTGLRGIPSRFLGKWCSLPGERFEYEMNMLIDCIRSHVDIREIGIETVYFDNSETHFDLVKDSLAIYGAIFSDFFKSGWSKCID